MISSDDHKTLAIDMAHESMTLLQNKNNILPLSNSVQEIAVVGPNADDAPLMWGNYNGTPYHTVTILDGIRSKLAAKKIVYDKGCDLAENAVTVTAIGECSIDGKPGIKATYWNNRESRAKSRPPSRSSILSNSRRSGSMNSAPVCIWRISPPGTKRFTGLRNREKSHLSWKPAEDLS